VPAAPRRPAFLRPRAARPARPGLTGQGNTPARPCCTPAAKRACALRRPQARMRPRLNGAPHRHYGTRHANLASGAGACHRLPHPRYPAFPTPASSSPPRAAPR
jgi:hypothetical protein